jgi:hypothetical protein
VLIATALDGRPVASAFARAAQATGPALLWGIAAGAGGGLAVGTAVAIFKRNLPRQQGHSARSGPDPWPTSASDRKSGSGEGLPPDRTPAWFSVEHRSISRKGFRIHPECLRAAGLALLSALETAC